MIVNRTLAPIALVSLIAVSCGGSGVLDGLGDRTSEAVVGTAVTTLTGVEPVSDPGEVGLMAAKTAAWFNDAISDQAIGLPSFTINGVWDRGHDAGRFVQSSRAEIAVALPGIAFPASIPDDVAWVTSQLVYLEDVATLDAGTSAAFGLWEVEPYSSEDGRVGVLRVGVDRGDLGQDEVLSEVVTSGLSLIWSDGRYRYELFCRAALAEELCRNMVVSAAPLRDLLGER